MFETEGPLQNFGHRRNFYEDATQFFDKKAEIFRNEGPMDILIFCMGDSGFRRSFSVVSSFGIMKKFVNAAA